MPWAWGSFTVGSACYRIIACNLMPYGIYSYSLSEDGFAQAHPPRPMYMKQHIRDVQSAREWWQGRSNKSLRELQLEVLEWTIAEEERSPGDYTSYERTYLKARRDKLLGSGTAFEPARVADGDPFYAPR
jgi:hypothetical protein